MPAIATALNALRNLFRGRPAQGAPLPRGPGPDTPGADARQWARATVERVRTASVTGVVRFLPYLDRMTEETDEIRRHYPVMLKEPTLKSALHSKVLAVASEDVQAHPEDPDDKDQAKLAELVGKMLRKVRGGTRKIALCVLAPAVLKGWSLSEVVLKERPERDGPFKGKILVDRVKSKNTDILQLIVDAWHNVVGVKANLYNGGHVFQGDELQSFILFSHDQWYEDPHGQSDFRAAYRAFHIKDTTWRLRALHLKRFTTPHMKGTYADVAQKAALEEAFAEFDDTTWLTMPVGAMAEALDIATRGTADYDKAIADCDREMLTAVCGAYLQQMESQGKDPRGDTEVHKEISQLYQWALADALGQLVGESLVGPWVRLNYHGLPPPTVTWGSVNDDVMAKRAKLDKALQEIGLQLSAKEAYRYYGRQRPADPQDVLTPKGPGGGPPPPGMPGPPGPGQGPQPGQNGQEPEGGEEEDPFAALYGGKEEAQEFGEAHWLEAYELQFAEPAGKPKAGGKPRPQQRKEGEVWQGPSGRYFTLRQGRVVPAPNPNKAPKGAKKPRAAKAPAESAQELHGVVTAMLAHPDRITAEMVGALKDRMLKLKATEIQGINQKVNGVKGSGSKDKLVQMVFERAGMKPPAAAPGPEKPAAPAPAPAKSEPFGYPKGYEPPHGAEGGNGPNPAVPDGARPPLTASEARAASAYSMAAYGSLNTALRLGQGPVGTDVAVHQGLRLAFAKAAPLAEPATVYRGVSVFGQDAQDFVAACRKAAGGGGLVRLDGYQSTSTGADTAFKATVTLKITASHGLDLKPYSNQPQEDEFLLPHASKMRVKGVRETRPGRWEVEMEQVLDPAADALSPEEHLGKAARLPTKTVEDAHFDKWTADLPEGMFGGLIDLADLGD